MIIYLGIFLVVIIVIFAIWCISKRKSNIANNNIENNSASDLKKKNKIKNILIILAILFVIVTVASISVSLYNNRDLPLENPSDIAGAWKEYNEMYTDATVILYLDGNGNYSCEITDNTSRYGYTMKTKKGTYKIEDNKITLYDHGSEWNTFEIINSKTLRSTVYGKKLEYRKFGGL